MTRRSTRNFPSVVRFQASKRPRAEAPMTPRVGAQTDRFVVFGHRRRHRSVGTPQVSTHTAPSFLLLLLLRLLLLQRKICVKKRNRFCAPPLFDLSDWTKRKKKDKKKFKKICQKSLRRRRRRRRLSIGFVRARFKKGCVCVFLFFFGGAVVSRRGCHA